MANKITIKDVEMKIGDTVKIYYKFKEGDKEKSQAFEGILMAIKGTGNNKMFRVRKLTKDKIGVERIFPVISPFIEKIKVSGKGNARRAKLYFIRRFSGRDLRERLT